MHGERRDRNPGRRGVERRRELHDERPTGSAGRSPGSPEAASSSRPPVSRTSPWRPARRASPSPRPLPSGTPYAITVVQQPTNPSQTCTVTNGSGTVGSGDVSAAVTCTTNGYRLGGTISGLRRERAHARDAGPAEPRGARGGDELHVREPIAERDRATRSRSCSNRSTRRRSASVLNGTGAFLARRRHEHRGELPGGVVEHGGGSSHTRRDPAGRDAVGVGLQRLRAARRRDDDPADTRRSRSAPGSPPSRPDTTTPSR